METDRAATLELLAVALGVAATGCAPHMSPSSAPVKTASSVAARLRAVAPAQPSRDPVWISSRVDGHRHRQKNLQKGHRATPRPSSSRHRGAARVVVRRTADPRIRKTSSPVERISAYEWSRSRRVTASPRSVRAASFDDMLPSRDRLPAPKTETKEAWRGPTGDGPRNRLPLTPRCSPTSSCSPAG